MMPFLFRVEDYRVEFDIGNKGNGQQGITFKTETDHGYPVIKNSQLVIIE
jgi:hypothetical protein